MADICPNCKDRNIAYDDRYFRPGAAMMMCKKCGVKWVRVLKFNPDYAMRPYSLFTRGLREVSPNVRRMGYKQTK